MSLIGAVLGLLGAIATAIGFILLWPLRTFLRRRRARKVAGDRELKQGTRSSDRPGPAP